MPSSSANDLQRISVHLKDAASAPWRWVFYGDSVTHGAAHTGGWRCFPEIFAERLRWEIQLEPGYHCLGTDVVINTAYSGWTTAELLTYYPAHVKEFHPQAVSVMIGMNDMIRPGIPQRFRENLLTLVRKIRDDGAIPLLHTCNRIIPTENPDYQRRFDALDEYSDITRRIASEEDILLIDNYAHWPDYHAAPEELRTWLGEPLHPGSRGHLEIARLMTRVLGMYSETSKCLHPAGLP